MKTLNLDFILRVKLSAAIGSALGLPLAAMRSLGATYDKICFSDDEVKQMTIEDLGNGRSNYTPPRGAEEFAKKQVLLEDTDANHLRHHLENWNGYQIADRVWIDPLLDKLSAQPERREKKGK